MFCEIGYSSDKSIEIKAGYFKPEDKVFRDVYSSGVKFGLEGSIEAVKNLEVWVGVDYFHKTGKITLTKEETKVRIIPFGAGIMYDIPVQSWLKLSLGGGVQYYSFKEENLLGTVTDGKVGFIIKGGGFFILSPNFGFNVFVNYSWCKMKPGEVEFKVGGLEAGAGLGFIF
ncbi:MAG: hypothetical protein WCC06_12795 [Candidatus Aminicenantales bacterium]